MQELEKWRNDGDKFAAAIESLQYEVTDMKKKWMGAVQDYKTAKQTMLHQRTNLKAYVNS